MATLGARQLGNYEKHSVGNLVSTRKHIQDLANGALFTEDVDNFHLVEVEFNPTSGEPEAKYLTDVTLDKSKVFLTAGVERRFLPTEDIDAFFNGKGDKERVVYLTQGLIFDVSAFEKDATITGEITTGHFAHYDTAKKLFLVHDGTATGYADASVKFVVRRNEADTRYTLGQPTIRLIVL